MCKKKSKKMLNFFALYEVKIRVGGFLTTELGDFGTEYTEDCSVLVHSVRLFFKG